MAVELLNGFLAVELVELSDWDGVKGGDVLLCDKLSEYAAGDRVIFSEAKGRLVRYGDREVFVVHGEDIIAKL